MNWQGPYFTLEDIDATPEISQYFADFPSSGDFGLAHHDGETIKAVAWLVFLPAEDPGYGFIHADTPELCMTTLAPYRCHGIGSALLEELISPVIVHDDQTRPTRRALSMWSPEIILVLIHDGVRRPYRDTVLEPID